MGYYQISGGEIELFFDGIPSNDTRTAMKAIRIWWDPQKNAGMERTLLHL